MRGLAGSGSGTGISMRFGLFLEPTGLLQCLKGVGVVTNTLLVITLLPDKSSNLN